MKHPTIKLVLAILALLSLTASFVAAQTPLDKYIEEGLNNNLVLQQKNISLEKALYNLKSANSLFLPSVNFNASYTHGEGGRSIALPVGDLMNPVYMTLNQMLDENRFPMIQNQEQTFFPKNFYDARIRTTFPVLNTDLYHNKTIQQGQLRMQEFEVRVYERELVKNIKTAYYNFLSASEAVNVYSSALQLVQENVNVNQSLLKNGKGLHAAVLRAETELENVKAQLHQAENNKTNAQRYFNFLLNKDQLSPIEIPGNVDSEVTAVSKLLLTDEVASREEIQMVKTGQQLTQSVLKMNQGFRIPKVGGFVDLGSQSQTWDFDSKSRYFLFGLTMDIPILNWNRNIYKIRQAEADLKSAEVSVKNTEMQLELGKQVAKNNLSNSFQNYNVAKQRLTSAQSYFKLIDRGYKEGTNSLIEYIDARNQLTGAQLGVTINTYQLLSAAAQYERETASYSFNAR